MHRPRFTPHRPFPYSVPVAVLTVLGLVLGLFAFASPANAAWSPPWLKHHDDRHRTRPGAAGAADPTGSAHSSDPAPTTSGSEVTATTTTAKSIPGKAKTTSSTTTTTSSNAARTGTTSKVTFSSAVPAIPTVKSATLQGAVRENARVDGRDNGTSVRMGNTSYWIFDDTTLKDPWGFLSNSAAATTDLNASDGIDLTSGSAFSTEAATPTNLIPHTAAETAFEKAHDKAATGCTSATDQYCGASFGFWPGNTVADPANHRILVFYGKLCRGGASSTPCSGPIGKGLGTGIAAINLTTKTVTRLSARNRTPVMSVEGADPTLLYADGQGAYSGATVVKGVLYGFGGCDFWACGTAKVPLTDVTHSSAWRYWDGTAWVADASKAVKQGPTPGSAGHSVFYNAALSSWVNMWMPYGTSTVQYQVAGRPWGPWSSAKTALVAPKGNGTTYAMFAHPEYAQRNGAVQFITWFDGASGDQKLARIEFAKS